MSNNLYLKKQEFLDKWSVEKLRTMTIEEYTNLNKTSFCYWLEHVTTPLGSIRGGHSYKFGVYRRNDTSVADNYSNRSTDGVYAWYNKYGSSAQEAFETVRKIIIQIAEFAQQNNLKGIDEIDLGNAYKWKIAFLYGNFNIMNIFKYEALVNSAEYLGYSGKDKSYAALNEFIVSQKGDKDFFEFSRQLWNAYSNPDDAVEVSQTEENDDEELNQILFGPPGTGKTFHTINEAIKIADPEFYKLYANDRDKLKERFKLLLINPKEENNGQIAFTTFHQSFSYEDFVEGIKPVKPEEGDEYLKYEVQEGIFKKVCRLAKDSLNAKEIQSQNPISMSMDEFTKAQFYKMSLGNTQLEEDTEIYEYCINNNCITIGFGDQIDFTGKDERQINELGREEKLSGDAIRSLNYFKNYLKVGNYVLISNGNYYVRAIGKVTGDYEYKESPFEINPTYNHFRTVEWLMVNQEIPIKDLYYSLLTQKTIYKLKREQIKPEFFVKEGSVSDDLKLPKNPKNFVLIADEINRGNVSSIFGELITLIEKDKRAGKDEELSVILPYSKEEFKVPQNVFIIGTMNTADRSIEALDTALRRRFSFTEMPPKPELISEVGELKEFDGIIGDVDVVRVLETINKRIEKLIDKDHKIGHSYFLKVRDLNDLRVAFRDKVIPLLEEYFFGDYGKIGLVLGNSFIRKTENEEIGFAAFENYDDSIVSDLKERAVYEMKHPNEWNFSSIY